MSDTTYASFSDHDYKETYAYKQGLKEAKDKEQQRILEGIIEREEKGYEARNILDSLKLELKYVKTIKML